MASTTDTSAHQEPPESTSAEQFPSTLAMCLANPSSTSLAPSLSGATDLDHHLHHDRPRSKAPSVLSEKVRAEDRSSTEVGDREIANEKGEYMPDVDPSAQAKILDYPEGGFGWLVVLASFIINFWAFAPNVTFGVYQEYFLRANTFPGASVTDISWIGSIGSAAMFLFGPFIAPMTRFMGLRAVVAIGILVATLGFILASFSTKLWQLYLTQGLLFGAGGGLVFFSSISITAQYFEKRRGLASGIAIAGSGIGSLALAPLTRFLITKVGIYWCQRIIGFAVLGCMTAVFPFIRPRFPTAKKGPIFDLSLFKVPGFAWLMVTAFVITFGYLVPIFLVPTYSSLKLGQPSSTGANLISIFSGINAVSRVGLGVAADKFGRTNTLFTCCVLAGVSCLAIWTVADTIGILTGFMVAYGLFGGGFISIFPVVVAQVVGVERLPAALGIVYFGNVFGNFFGAPIATAILNSQHGDYIGTIIFAGVMPILGAVAVLFVRFRINKKIFAIA